MIQTPDDDSEGKLDENSDINSHSGNYFHENQSDSLDYYRENFDHTWNEVKIFLQIGVTLILILIVPVRMNNNMIGLI